MERGERDQGAPPCKARNFKENTPPGWTPLAFIAGTPDSLIESGQASAGLANVFSEIGRLAAWDGGRADR